MTSAARARRCCPRWCSTRVHPSGTTPGCGSARGGRPSPRARPRRRGPRRRRSRPRWTSQRRPSRRHLQRARRIAPARRRLDGRDEGVDVGRGGGVAEREPERVARLGVVAAHREQDVEGCGTPAEQAEPVEHSMPRASRSMRRESPSQPGNRGGRRRAAGRAAGAPWRWASGTTWMTWGTRSSRSSAIARRGRLALTVASTAAARPAIAGTSRVPLRMSCADRRRAPSALTGRSRRTTRAPTP